MVSTWHSAHKNGKYHVRGTQPNAKFSSSSLHKGIQITQDHERTPIPLALKESECSSLQPSLVDPCAPPSQVRQSQAVGSTF